MIYYIIYALTKFCNKVTDMNRLYRLNKVNIRKYGVLAFVLGLALSAAFIIPVIIEQGGVFFYYGDFNAQEIPFYQLVHDAVREGNLSWSPTTDLGSATVASYSFYLMGSPFFWLTIPFPSEWVPYLMGPLFMLKFACASLSAYIYLMRYAKGGLAVAGSLLYAFSGFSIYNIFFFHFHEPMIMFPLSLAALDSFMFDERRGALPVAVFAACAVNYYFFAGMAVFTAIYWLVQFFTNNYKMSFKKLGLLAFEIVLGFAATAFLLLPTVMFITGNPRLSEFPDGYNALVHDMPQRYWYIVLSFFFPPELPAQPNFAPGVECNWASVSGWLPLCGMTGVIAYLQLKKRDWLKKLITLLILFALVPVLNSMFQLFNMSIYYARWFYMFILMLTLATVLALKNNKADWNRAICWSVGITVGIALLTGLMPNTVYDEDDNPTTYIGVMEYIARYWVYVAIAMVSLALFVIIIKLIRRDGRRFSAALVAGICLVTVLSSTYIVQTGNSLDSDEKPFLRAHALNKGGELKIDDIKNVRSDFYENIDNLAMYWQIPSINAFHSVVTPSIMEFYDSIGVTRDVASRPEATYYGIRGLLSCKYLFDRLGDDEDFEKKGNTKMPGWKYLKTVNGCKVYENEHYIPMGFTYDSFITEEEFLSSDERNRSEALLKALVLSAEDALRYGKITGYTSSDVGKIKSDVHKFNSNYKDFKYGRFAYFDDCKALSESSCSDFTYNNEGFTATFDNKGDDNLLFFSVPYDKGWTAFVNGEPREIVKAGVGFMAVKVDGGKKSEVVFKYNPPGFHTGIIISVCCGIIFLMYLSILFVIRRRK